MNKMNIVLIWCLLSAHVLQGAQFAYPVADLGNGNMFVIYQQSVEDIELWLWNSRTKLAVKELSSMFVPSDVQLLPNGESFSFLDRGRIWIKSFYKRMPRSIDILEPIDSIFSVKWLTGDLCYFSGRHYRTYDVFLCDISKGLQPDISFLTHMQGVDILYPCKHENELYCVLKDELHKYALVKFDWDPIAYREGFDSCQKPKVLYVSDSPICSLSIETDGSGVFVSCPSDLSNLEELIDFECFTFNCTASADCVTNRAFGFSLPTAYLLSGSRAQLRESMDRFLPHCINGDIYFSSCSDSVEKCFLYKYYQGSVEQVSCRGVLSSTQNFTPVQMEDKLCFGMILPGYGKRNLLEVDAKTGVMEFDLPCEYFCKNL